MPRFWTPGIFRDAAKRIPFLHTKAEKFQFEITYFVQERSYKFKMRLYTTLLGFVTKQNKTD